MILQAVPVAISDGRLLGREVELHLGARVARAVRARHRIGTKRLLPLEFQKSATSIRLARLSGFPLEFRNAGDGHRMRVAKARDEIKLFTCSLTADVLGAPSFLRLNGRK